MSLDLFVDFATDADVEDIHSSLKLGSVSVLDDDRVVGTIGRNSQVSLGRVAHDQRWNIARDVFGIDAAVSLVARLDKSDPTPELLRSVRSVLDHVAVAGDSGLIRYLDLAIVRWKGREVSVNTKGSFSDSVGALVLSDARLSLAREALDEI